MWQFSGQGNVAVFRPGKCGSFQAREMWQFSGQGNVAVFRPGKCGSFQAREMWQFSGQGNVAVFRPGKCGSFQAREMWQFSGQGNVAVFRPGKCGSFQAREMWQFFVSATVWSEWSSWTTCSAHAPCGKRKKTRQRICLHAGAVDRDPACTGAVKQEGSCPEFSCDAPIRLFGGAQFGEGHVQMYDRLSGRWGHVCADVMDTAAADVICRQLGMRSGTGTCTSYGIQ
ncbi:uncharacterized protein LOC144919432 [Branchiostoma floridae x Branchiostoma belcheri]